MTLPNQYSHLKFKYHIPDPIWGRIPITEKENEVIQHPMFTRLLDVRQMGVASVAFPGAIHNRYQHSIGVMHVADQLLTLVRVIEEPPEKVVYLSDLDVITVEVRETLRLAALLHDIGHPPLSHVVEEAFRKHPEFLTEDSPLMKHGDYSHENATRYLLRLPEFKEMLSRVYPGELIARLPDLAVGDSPDYPFYLLNPLINGDLDADKIDYLRRDGHYCGFLTTYNLPDFDSAIRLQFTPKGPRDQLRVFVAPRSIGAVNAFLLSRYREIDEIHHSQKARIATQTVIEGFISGLATLPSEKRAELLLRLHLSKRDSDLPQLFGKHSNFSKHYDKIRRGQIPFQEVLLPREAGLDRPLDFDDFSPLVRLCLHSILCYPPAIAEAQTRLRQSLHPELVLDIRTAKPPKFSLNVNYGWYKPTIFTASEITRGLLRESIRNLRLHLYVPEGQTFTIETPKVVASLVETARWATSKHYISKGTLMPHNMIVLVMRAIQSHAAEYLSLSPGRVYGQWHLQFYIPFISRLIDVRCPYPYIVEGVADPDFVRDIEILTTLGILQERESPVNMPTRDDAKHRYVFRHDYCLTPYGTEYADEVTSSKDHPIGDAIRSNVEALQNTLIVNLRRFLELEDEISLARVREDDETSAISLERKIIREETLGNACLLVR